MLGRMTWLSDIGLEIGRNLGEGSVRQGEGNASSRLTKGLSIVMLDQLFSSLLERSSTLSSAIFLPFSFV